MDEVFTLTIDSKETQGEEFIYSSQNIFDILDRIFELPHCENGHIHIYVTDFGRNCIPYKKWRQE